MKTAAEIRARSLESGRALYRRRWSEAMELPTEEFIGAILEAMVDAGELIASGERWARRVEAELTPPPERWIQERADRYRDAFREGEFLRATLLPVSYPDPSPGTVTL